MLPLKPISLDILQINVGYMCNQTCTHCHVDAGPDRKEIMTKETMQQCLDVIDNSDVHTVDLTGGAPEMNPNFRWFVEEITKRGAKVLVRCNLTIIRANPKYHDLPLSFKEHGVEVVSSLPCYTAGNTDAQRGDGVFAKSIKALQMLNEVGYGKPGTGLTLNLVYNPGGAFLSPPQEGLEKDYEKQLMDDFGIEFNNLYAINNIPISRFLEYLDNAEKLDEYMTTLVNAYNPAAAKNVMCRSLISVGWDGRIFDCDFNQMLNMELGGEAPKHVRDFNLEKVLGRTIRLNQHCYGCTAGSGSSCGGATV